MRYAQFDYHPKEAIANEGKMRAWWSSHWEGRAGWRADLRDEPLWPTIADILERPGRLLEAGCGPGQWVEFFDSLGHTAIGADFAQSGLRAGKSYRPALRLLSADLRVLPFPDEAFDYIYCNGAVEHDPAGPEAALREFRRVLAPTGRLMCSVPCLNIERMLCLGWFIVRDWLKRRELLRRLAGKTDPFEFYEYIYAPWTYRSILESCGFEVLALRPYGRLGDSYLTRVLGGVLRRISRFHNNHMMMAICRKREGGAP